MRNKVGHLSATVAGVACKSVPLDQDRAVHPCAWNASSAPPLPRLPRRARMTSEQARPPRQQGYDPQRAFSKACPGVSHSSCIPCARAPRAKSKPSVSTGSRYSVNLSDMLIAVDPAPRNRSAAISVAIAWTLASLRSQYVVTYPRALHHSSLMNLDSSHSAVGIEAGHP
jgi:hypothetical protein